MSQIFTFLIIYLLKISSPKVLAQPALNIFSIGKRYSCALTNDSSSALLWDSQNVGANPSKTILCDIEQKSGCVLFNTHSTTEWFDDLDFAPILDYRWEGIEGMELAFGNPVLVYQTLADSFRISFSFKGVEIHILLCDRSFKRYWGDTYGNCYWIGFGANKGTKNFLRKCKEGEIPTALGTYAKGPCSESKNEIIAENIIRKDRWSHLSVTKRGNSLEVDISDRPEVQLRYKDNLDLFTVSHVIVRSGTEETGFMKVHKVRVVSLLPAASTKIELKSTSVSSCIALYVRTCEHCSLNITLIKPEVVTWNQTKKEDGWQRIIFEDKDGDIGSNSEIIITSLEKGTSYISSTIQNCGVIPVTKYITYNGCCHALKYPSLSICVSDTLGHPVETGDLTCPVNTIGENCLPCTSFNKNDCEKSKLCYTTLDRVSKCFCGAGYQDTNCQTECSSGTYGHNCKQKCGNCAYKTCHYINGNCDKCEENFIEPFCVKPKLPIVKKEPTAKTIKHREIVVDLDLNYDGEENPEYYAVQYKEEFHSTWTQTQLMSYSKDATQQFSDLNPNTLYFVRVVLFVNTKIGYNGDRIPKLEVRTTCRDDIDTFMTVNPKNTSMIINTHFNRSTELCPLTEFRLCLYQNLSLKGCIEEFHFSVVFENLEPNEQYRLLLYRNKSYIKEWTARTLEGAPEKVQNFRLDAVSNTSIELSWDEPKKKNGNIQGYRIEYSHSRWKGCSVIQANVGVTNRTVLGTKVCLHPLLPYSSYLVKIWAFTVYEGISISVPFDTSETEMPTEREFPEVTFVRSDRKSYLITFHWNCRNIEGTLHFTAIFICNSKWCINQTQNIVEKVTYFKESLEYTVPVIGYTNYTVRMFTVRNNFKIYKDTKIQSSATEPGPVRNVIIYSKTNTSVSVRWLPPDPPMGEIDYYTVTTRTHRIENIIPQTSECEIWRGQICKTISNLKSNAGVSIRVKAKNAEPGGYGDEIEVYAVVKEEISEPPQHVLFEWDNEYGLTLFWQHPDITNGPLQQFLITFNNKPYMTYNVSKEKAQYKYELNLTEEFTSQQITVAVKAKNSAGISQSAQNSTYTPPKMPELVASEFKEEKTNTTITIEIPAVTKVEGDKSNMYIIITDLNSNQITERVFLHPLEHQLLKDVNVSTSNSWVASEFNLMDSVYTKGFFFQIGNTAVTNSSIDKDWKLNNFKLSRGSTYIITIVLNNTFKEFTRLKVYRLNSTVLPSEPTNYNPLFYVLLLLIPIILCILCVLLIRRNRQKVASSIHVTFQKLGLSRSSTEVPLTPLPREDKTPMPQSTVTKPAIPVVNKKLDSSSTEMENYSKLVKICDLNDYIKKCIETGEFEKQHGVFQRGQTKPWICGTKPQNKSKNRYINLAAYDHTRVKLKVTHQDPFSDYINANYIDGYKSKNTYIATQGPKVSTLNDFWRMIWQENVEFIIMIANIVEGGKKKVEKYWPEINESKEFSNIKVEYLSVDVMANYEIRHFIVSCENERRKVQQFHFLTWPDHGVPLYPQSLSPFLKKMLTIPQGGPPVVVHCSAGVGRTGSLILCDICLRMAAREGKIDAFHYLNKIREQRVNMVDNVEQYKLVHLVLLQCLVAPETGILCNETMENNIETVLATKIDQEMQYLDESAWQDEAMRNTNFNSDVPIIHSKNRFKNIVPDPASRICLTAYPSSDPSSVYINAVSVDAFAVPAKFVVTQNPLSSTVGDFWRLVEQKEITLIVCLNQLDFQEKTTCKFYPTSSANSIKPVPYLEIKYVGKEVNAHFKVYSMIMSNLQTQEDVQIKIIHLNNWHHSVLHPENPVGLLTTYEEMNYLGRNSDAILITCHDGAKGCGLYVAMCFIIDKVKMEQICDVCLAVRTVRHSRKEFVRNTEQYSFLYKCALEYVRQFEMYSNFSSTRVSK